MKRVLVVDDVAQMCTLLSAILTKEGFEVMTANSGKRVLDLLAQDEKFDIMLIDINLEDVSGVELLKLILKFPSCQDAKVCFVSGVKDKTMVVKALQAGGQDYIIKPIDPQILVTKVKHLLGGSGRRIRANRLRFGSRIDERALRNSSANRETIRGFRRDYIGSSS